MNENEDPEIDYSQPYELIYQQTFDDCRDDCDTHRQWIEREIGHVQNLVRGRRQMLEIRRIDLNRGAEWSNVAGIDPAYMEAEIEHLQGYFEFLIDKQKRLLKNTRELFAKEKYAYLEMLGLFQTEVWKGVLQNTPTDQRERLISEILGCDIDAARHIMNGRDSLKEEKRAELQNRINQMSKGV